MQTLPVYFNVNYITVLFSTQKEILLSLELGGASVRFSFFKNLRVVVDTYGDLKISTCKVQIIALHILFLCAIQLVWSINKS